jgi:DNA uptake protein ComE-like DNA-binding protein
LKTRLTYLLLIFLCSINLFGQNQRKLEYEAQKNLVLEQSIEILAANLETEDVDFQTLFDNLSIYYENPIQLNRKDIQTDLIQLGLLSEYQIQNLLTHLEKNGKLISIYELQAVPGFDLQTIRNIMPFVDVSAEFYTPHTGPRELFKNATNELFIRYSRVLENQKGFQEITDEDWLNSQNSRYLGSADRLYMRYRFKYLTNLSIGVTMEKDQGESFFGNQRAENLFGIQSQKGFDFYSAHFFIKNVGPIKALAIGDFQAQFGQGLTFWSGLAFGKSINILTAKRNAQGLRPYTSVDENLFLRGAGVTLGLFKAFEFTAFGSKKKIDANISAIADTTIDGNIDNLTITSFQATGSHATIGELEDKQAIDESIIGGRFAYNTRRLNFGVTGSHTIYGGDIERTLQPYSQFQFNSNTNTTVGTDFNFIYKNFNFFGEGARSANGGTGLVSGFLASLGNDVSFSMVYRNYSKDFQNLKSVAFAESSTNVNEKGIFTGFDGKLNKNWTVSAYMDQFKFPWLRNQVDAPNTAGFDAIFQLRYKPSRNLDIYARVRRRNKPINTDLEVSDIPSVVKFDQNNYRINVIYKVSPAIRLQSRVEYVTYNRIGGEEENGLLIFQDINVKPLSSPFSFSFRYAIFDTQSFNTRLYAYENDVLYYFAIPAYANRGTRMYLTARYKVSRGVDVWLRYGQWFYNNVETIGSGLTEISGNRKSEVRALLVFSF